MKTLSKVSLTFFSILFLLLVLPFVILHMKFVYPVDSFCRDIDKNETREKIILAGKAQGFLIWEWQESDDIWIVNHDEGPLFRVACSTQFKDGKLIQKETVYAD